MGLSVTGGLHTFFACLALISGTIILFLKKGTFLHRKTGYVYVCAMLLMNGTAFTIYRLFQGPGIFHLLSVVSLLTLGAGLYPVWFRARAGNWRHRHAKFMAWSLIGLYAALVSEIATRLLPKAYFMLVVSLGSVLVILMGYRAIKHNLT